MSALEMLNKRLNYRGGNQQQRMIQDKLCGLKKALLYSYQAATLVLSDGRQFRCLINPDKNKPAYDNKILSIPYEDICLNSPRKGKTSEGVQKVNIKTGDVFTWKQTNTHWLVYLQVLEEDAYFRSEIRRCDQQITVNKQKYWVYIRGPVETSIEWTQKAGVEWNTLNYSLVMYITADDNTNSFFKRFEKVKILNPNDDKEKTWQVVGVDPYYGDGIIQVFLDEYFENSIEQQVKEKESENQQTDETTPADDVGYITGPLKVKQYSSAQYEIHNAENGKWYARRGDIVQDLKDSSKILQLKVNSNQLGVFTLIYRVQGKEDITLDVTMIPI